MSWICPYPNKQGGNHIISQSSKVHYFFLRNTFSAQTGLAMPNHKEFQEERRKWSNPALSLCRPILKPHCCSPEHHRKSCEFELRLVAALASAQGPGVAGSHSAPDIGCSTASTSTYPWGLRCWTLWIPVHQTALHSGSHWGSSASCLWATHSKHFEAKLKKKKMKWIKVK